MTRTRDRAWTDPRCGCSRSSDVPRTSPCPTHRPVAARIYRLRHPRIRLTYTVYAAGVCCSACGRGPYRSRLTALPHAFRCWLSPLKRLGWWAGCRVGYPVKRGSNSRAMKWLAAHLDPYEGP